VTVVAIKINNNHDSLLGLIVMILIKNIKITINHFNE
jgi:hypothetical protein